MQTAHWITHEDDERLCLQIELGRDYAVTLTYWKDGEPPTARLWHGSREHDFRAGQQSRTFERGLNTLRPLALERDR